MQQHALLTCAVGFLASVPGAAYEVDGNALSLLQMSSARVSVQSDKECKVASKALKDAQKKTKTDRKAAKAARAAWKAAKQTLQESKEAEDAAYSKVEELCPTPEIDRSADVGCSATVITSCVAPRTQAHTPLLLERGLPHSKWYGFEEVLPGGGVPSVPTPTGDGGSTVLPQTTKEMRDLGIAVMQPCSVAWTVGRMKVPMFMNLGTGKLGEEQVFKKKDGLKSPCECRAWAETVMPWPQGVAVSFLGVSGTGGGTTCTVYGMTGIPWIGGGFGLTLINSMNTDFTCYLGNPEEWKERLDQEKAVGHTIDKCRKTGLWASGTWAAQADRVTRSTVQNPYVGKLSFPDPGVNTEGGRKMCLRWVKGNPKCANAIAIELNDHGCSCVITTNSIRTSHNRQDAPWITNQVCML